MPDVVCNTSPLQYLFQIGRLDLLPALLGRLIVPQAVVDELAVGRAAGVPLPIPEALPWVDVRKPTSSPVLPLVTDLGPGERQVLALALEMPGSVVILDDALARRVATTLGIRLRGTLGILLDAKRRSLVDRVAPLLDELQACRFRLSGETRVAILDAADEG